MKSTGVKFGWILFLFVALWSQHSLAQEAPFQLNPGDKALNFKSVDQNGETFELYEALKKGPVVLMFYRGFWCPHCNKQLSQMEDSLNFITEKGGIVVAVTPEQPESVQKTVDKTGASFKILYDQDLAIMNTYHVAFKLEEAILEKYNNWGIDLAVTNGDNGPNLPVPATYIIGQNKKILYAFFDPDYKKRATVGKILQNL
ncbi:AhpC/TSA family protein [Reichenbachiella carrageenanivorans]|uniref:thioredoxin-dependent peroxiredoxin n=1 Tax=Reichenbachiella carrageenanivorans TaxID=2979869 RepID=A0ABY6D665_9BACT|nr:peroxiredoxin-like family protein [Reichenbachiella carrageenanivorans]UXX80563.1 AhpC/TSA family protein [Reichenbachiella carrageenanivorans]